MQNTEKHKYTQAEFDAFPVIDGVKQCPTGDYSEIRHFGQKCSFGEYSFFSDWCIFVKGCSFGEGCYVGKYCYFGNYCSFGERCHFATGCAFDERCTFGTGCSFGKNCSFDKGCSFGMLCLFGKCCSFKKGCVCEFGEFLQMCRFEHNKLATYAFALTDGSIGIRCGCFTGNLDEFRKEAQKTHGDNKLGKEYLVIADLISARFGKPEIRKAVC